MIVVNQLARQLVSAQQQMNKQLLASTQQLNTAVNEAIDSIGVNPTVAAADLLSYQLKQDRIIKLNSKWSALRKLVDKKRNDLNSKVGVQTFHIESISWIQDKIRVIQSTEHLDNDLNGVMQMQRHLSGLERDIAASNSGESSQHTQVTGTGIDLIDHQLRAQIKEDIRKRISELNL